MLLINYLEDTLKTINTSVDDSKSIIGMETEFSNLGSLINEDISNINKETLSYIEMSLLARYHDFMQNKYPEYKILVYDLFKNTGV